MDNTMFKYEFYLPEEDTEYISHLNLPWETIKDGGVNWLLIHHFPIPNGYNVSVATVAIQIPASYPMAALDMVYFSPSLKRIDDKHIPATECSVNIRGCSYQRWSRHWTVQNPWRCGLDSLSSHLSLVEEWLIREFKNNQLEVKV